VRLPVPVVVIGNLTAGGTGKTPVTIAIADSLRRRGYRPVYPRLRRNGLIGGRRLRCLTILDNGRRHRVTASPNRPNGLS